MAQSKVKIRSLFVAEEVTFGTDPSADGSGYVYLHAEAELPKWGYEMVANPLQNDRLVPSAPEVGAKKASLSIKIPLRGSGTPSAPPATPAIAAETDLLVKQILGSVQRGQSSAVTAGGAGSTINVTDSSGFKVGGVVWATADGKPYFVTSIPNGTSVTVAPAPAAPITTGNLIAGSYYTPASSGHASLAFHAKVDGVGITLLGGRLTSAKLSGLAGGARPVLEVAYEFDSWVEETKGSLPAADDRFPAVVSPIVKGGIAVLGSTQTLVSGVDLDFGTETAWVKSTEGAEGRSGFEVVNREVKGGLMPYYDAAHMADLAAGSDKAVGFATRSQTNGFGFYAPKCRFVEHEPEDREGALGVKLSFGVFDNGADAEFVLTVA